MTMLTPPARPLRGKRAGAALVLVVAAPGDALPAELAALPGFDAAPVSPVQVLPLLVTHRPDVVIVDLTVDEDDALALCARVRAAPAGVSVPILVLARSDQSAAVERACAHGATDFVTKPVSAALLAHRVRQLVAARLDHAAVASAARGLARATRLARVVQWRFDPEARSFRWLDGARDVHPGFEGESTLAESLLRWVHPSDRARVEAAFAHAAVHRLEYRLVLADGSERIVYQLAETETDLLSGRPCLSGSAHDVTELRDAEGQIARLAYYDELTGLPNRSHACRFLKAAIAEASMRGQQLAVLSLDLDHFRRVNDNFGHFAGNELLREVAARIRAVLGDRASRQRAPEALVARLGGDEFVVVLRNVTCDEDAPALFGLLSARLSEPYLIGSAAVVVPCSAGIASYPANGTDVDTLLMNADAALHAAKDRGRDGFQLFDVQVQQRVLRRLDVESRLRAALACGTCLELHYQPKVDEPSGRVHGVEALLRWSSPTGGPISPPELVSVAEDSDLINQLGDWILRTACLQAKAWSAGGQPPIRVAVNVAARQFGAADFAERVERMLAETDLPAELLELEITEGAMMAETGCTARALRRLHERGIRIALDDFGTGYSSLAYLTRFPIDVLKIDRSFIKEIGVTRKSEAIVGAIFAMARSLAIEVVAEGVETEAQRLFLRRFGDFAIQGWLYTKALPGGAVAAWIASHAAGAQRATSTSAAA